MEAVGDCLACGALYTEVRDQTGEHDGIHAALFECVLKASGSKGAPVALGDKQIVLLETGVWNDLGGDRRRGARVRIAMRSVRRQRLHIRKIHAHIHDLRHLLAESIGHAPARIDDALGGMRLDGHTDDAVLKVYKNKRCFYGIDLKVNGTHLVEGMLNFSLCPNI